MHELPVQYARDGARIWILPGSPEHKTWWRNLRDGAEVDLVLAGHGIHGHAMVIDGTRQPEFAEGLAAYLRAVPQARRALGLTKHASPSSGDTEVRQIAARRLAGPWPGPLGGTRTGASSNEVASQGVLSPRPGCEPLSEQRLATGGGTTRAPARRLGWRAGLGRGLHGGLLVRAIREPGAVRFGEALVPPVARAAAGRARG
jgi:hypothetical protein